MHQKDNRVINEKEYCEFLLFLYNFFVCYNIIGEENSNKLEDVIYKYSVLLENEFNESIAKQFFNSIKTRIPSLEWFEIAVKKMGYSSSKHTIFTGSQKSNRIKVVLDILEDFFEGKTDSAYTLEHIVPDSSDDVNVVQIGNIVKVLDIEFNEEIEYTIVGSTEVDLALNRISNESPMGSALLGAKKGEVVEVEAPAGIMKYKILAIKK